MKSESLTASSAAGLAALLSGSVPYSSWSKESIEEIVALGQQVTLRKGDVLHANHSQSAHVYFLETGVLQSRVMIADGRDHITAYLHPGALVGLSHVFALLPFPQVHEFVVNTDALLWQVSAESFKDLMWRHRCVGETVAAILASRSTSLLDDLANTVLLSAEARVARCLLQSQQEPSFHALWNNFKMSANQLSQAQLCRILGLSRQSVGNVLRSFEGNGFIKMGRQRIEILSPSDLQKVVGGTIEGASAH